MRATIATIVLCLILPFSSSCVAQKDSPVAAAGFPVLSGPYLGQQPPGKIAELFAPGIISKEERGFAITFSPDGKECFYTKRSSGSPAVIMTTSEVNHRWIKPRIADFIGTLSGGHSDSEPHISPDGTLLIFARSVSGLGGSGWSYGGLYYSRKTDDGWSDIKLLALETEFCMFVSVAAKGNLYFTGTRGKIYVSKYIDGHYRTPEVVSGPVNEMGGSAHPFIAPDESYIIFDSYTDEGKADLFISFADTEGKWTAPIKFDSNINSSASELAPFVSRDNKYLFFSRFSGDVNIFWVDATIIEELRPKNEK